MQQFMNTALLDVCTQHGSLHHYQAGQIINQRGDSKQELSIVLSGQVKVGNYGLDGQYQLTTYLQKGETFGEFTLLANLARTHDSEAVDKVTIILLNQQTFTYLNQHNSDFNAFMLSSIAIKLHSTLAAMDDLRRLPTHVRLAKFLYTQSQHSGSNTIKIRQSDCAEWLTVSVLSCHKALQKLKSLQLVSSSYGAIIINDKTKLEQWLNQHSSLLPVNT